MTTDKDDKATAAATTAGNGEWIQVKGEDLQVKVRTMDERKEGRKEGRKKRTRFSLITVSFLFLSRGPNSRLFSTLL